MVAEDGLKAVLTLRLAPILPIPIGLYNYVYGVSSIPYLPFAGGIFLGSLKPYLLDSYLGVFGKQVVDGTVNEGDGLQDIILLAALGFSVLIGVFASELAGETWDSVKSEIEEEEKRKKQQNPDEVDDDGIMRQFLGFQFPDWVVGAQLSLKEADERMETMIKTEYNARVWNCTEDNPPPLSEDPSQSPTSPEKRNAGKGFDGVAAICDGLVLSPALMRSYFKYADPLFDEKEDIKEPVVSLEEARSTLDSIISSKEAITTLESTVSKLDDTSPSSSSDNFILTTKEAVGKTRSDMEEKDQLLKVLNIIRRKTENKLGTIEQELESLKQ